MKIINWEEHKAALTVLDKLIEEGFEGNAQREELFSELAVAIEAFEDSIPLMPIRANPCAGNATRRDSRQDG